MDCPFVSYTVHFVEQEVRRAKKHGFTKAELNEIKDRYTYYHESAVKIAETRESSDLTWDLIDTIKGREHRVFSTPEKDLDIIEKALDAATLETVHRAFKEYWDTEDLALFLTAKDVHPEFTADSLEKLHMESKQVEVAAPEEGAAVEFGYTDFGPPGSIVSDTMVEDLDIRQVVLSNNIRVNLKQTDFDKSYVAIAVRFGTGKLEQPHEPWLDGFAETVMDYGGLGKHSIDEIDTIFADNSVWNEFWVNNDDFEFSSEIIQDDLEEQLQVSCAE